MFSVVIPTMWQSEYLLLMLPIYENCDLVVEVILIDNAFEKKPNLTDFKKIRYYSEFKNIFVNPAWNVGYKLAKHKIILANDDILIENLTEVLQEIKNSNFDIIGVSWEQSNTLRIEEIDEFKRSGFGCFMYVKHYTTIPENYLIFRGDYILFQNNTRRGELFNPKIKGEIGKTRKSDETLREISLNDLCKYSQNNLNV